MIFSKLFNNKGNSPKNLKSPSTHNAGSTLLFQTFLHHTQPHPSHTTYLAFSKLSQKWPLHGKKFSTNSLRNLHKFCKDALPPKHLMNYVDGASLQNRCRFFTDFMLIFFAFSGFSNKKSDTLKT